MANIYVGQFKDILKNYYAEQKKLKEKIEENKKRFSEEYAEKENEEIKKRQVQAYEKAKANINDIFTTVRDLLAKSNVIDVDQITSDRLLFSDDSGFDLSVAEVQGFVDRYKNNYTMLRLIKDWLTKQNTATKENPFGKYAGVNITLPVDMVNTYKTFAESALRLIETIYNGNSESLAIDSYADENFSRDLYAVIGDGMKLSDYTSKNVPDTVQHSFDDITLMEQNTNYFAGI